MNRTDSSRNHLDHLLHIDQLIRRSKRGATRTEALHELEHYRNQGLIIQQYGKEQPMAKKTRAHSTPDPKTFTGRGIMFAIVEDREQLVSGSSTIDVIADAIEQALDSGHETSDAIARYLTTSAFQHIPDKRVRFNSVLHASDVVGANLVRKLMNAYNELAAMAEEEEDPQEKKRMQREASGFAEAVNIVLSPFSTEDAKDYRLVDWEKVDRITEKFEKEQRLVRRERKGNPQ